MPGIVTLFAHYHADNIIADYVLFHLKALQHISQHVVFITTADPSEEELAKLTGSVSEIIVQPQNVGFDFYSWSSYLKKNRSFIESYDGLLLTNSSIIGPLFPLQPMVEKMAHHAYWGMTDSYEIGYHLQSYFVFFQKKVLNTQIFWDFFENIIPFPSVESVIQSYEVNLTIYFRHYFGNPGVVANPKFSYRRKTEIKWLSFNREKRRDVVLYYKHWGLFKYFEFREPVNPMLCYPNQLLATDFPYVKVKLLSNNVYCVPLQTIKRQLQDVIGYRDV